MKSEVIEVSHLSKSFGDVRAVDSISFSVSAGEIFGLLGPNGAGKTTTIHLMLGLTTADHGSVRIFGLNLFEHRRQVLQRVNFSSAYVTLPPNLTVRENLLVFARLYGIHRPSERIAQLLDLFEIGPLRDRLTGALSTGQLSRLNLCKALLNDPEVLFLDEPTAGLDPDIADKVRSALTDIQAKRRVTMIYTSHNMREMEQLCDRVTFLHRGKIVLSGTPKEVLQSSGSDTLENVFIALARSRDQRDQTSDTDFVAREPRGG